MLDPIYQSTQFLMQALTELYMLLVCFRVIMHWAHVSYANPLLLGVARVTSPCLSPIYNLIPDVRGLDLAAVTLLLILSMSRAGLLFWWQTGCMPSLPGLTVLAIAAILKQFIDIFLFMLIVFSLISWFHPLGTSAFTEIVVKVTAPLLSLVQRVLPPTAGIDFSPFLTMLGLKLMMILIVAPLMQKSIMMLKA